MSKRITLRDYQQDVKQRVREKYALKVKRVLLVMPTGSGKTVVFSDIALDVVSRKKYVLILAHRIELLEQCGSKLDANGVDFGYLNPKYSEKRSSHVQVGTMQTVIKRLEKMNIVPDLIIIDEAHRSMSATYLKIVSHYPSAHLLGVTATPIRGDNKSLSDLYEDMVQGPQIKEMMSRGALVSRVTTYGPLSQLDLSGVDVNSDGEWNQKQLQDKLDEMPERVGDAVSHYKKFCHGQPAVAFCVSIEDSKNVCASFCNAGYKFIHIDGESRERVAGFAGVEMDGVMRYDVKAVIYALELRLIDGITSVDLVTEGLDVPMLSVAILLRPVRNVGLYIQMAGRVLRPSPGKEQAWILDHAGCVFRHGLVTKDREWILDGAEAKKRAKATEKEIKTKQCPTCYLFHEPAPSCPKCGHVYVVESRQISEGSGSLQEITEDMAERLKFYKKQEVGRAQTLEELKAIEASRGYKTRDPIKDAGRPIAGWAEQVFYARNKKKDTII